MIEFLEALELRILWGRWMRVGPEVDDPDRVSSLGSLLHEAEQVRGKNDICQKLVSFFPPNILGHTFTIETSIR